MLSLATRVWYSSERAGKKVEYPQNISLNEGLIKVMSGSFDPMEAESVCSLLEQEGKVRIDISGLCHRIELVDKEQATTFKRHLVTTRKIDVAQLR